MQKPSQSTQQAAPRGALLPVPFLADPLSAPGLRQAAGAALVCFALVLGAAGCTNYSSDSQIVATPILLAIQTEGSGHIISVAAQNVEIGFLGYRIYQATSESGLRALPVDGGTDCGPIATQPNTSVEYVMEVKPGQTTVTAGTTNRVCAFNASLGSGNYVGVRSLIFSLTAVGTSEISNALYVP